MFWIRGHEWKRSSTQEQSAWENKKDGEQAEHQDQLTLERGEASKWTINQLH